MKEPQPTFSACFGAPFLPQPPAVYARMLGEKLDATAPGVWLVNTGWTGGPYGEGSRMPISATRALSARRWPASWTAWSTERTRSSASRCPCRRRASTRRSSILAPPGAIRRRTTAKARELARMFRDSIAKFDVSEPVAAAGPHA